MDAVTPVLSNALPELRRIYRVDIQRAVPAVPTLDRRSRWQEDHRSGQSQGRAEKSGGSVSMQRLWVRSLFLFSDRSVVDPALGAAPGTTFGLIDSRQPARDRSWHLCCGDPAQMGEENDPWDPWERDAGAGAAQLLSIPILEAGGNVGGAAASGDKYPDPVPATMNAVTFRTIFTKMDFVERIREVRYQGKCPRVLNAEVSFRSESGGRSPTAWTSFEETLLINSFYLRFSQKARAHGIKVTSPVCSQWTQKYKPEAPMEKRSYEWYFPETKQRLHLGLHDAKEEEDLWIFLRQLTGLEDLNAAKEFIWNNAGKYGLEAFRREEVSLVLGCFVRWSEKARMMGLLSSTKLRAVHKDGKSVEFLLSNGEKLWMSSEDLKEEEDLWTWILDLSRVPMQSLVGAEEAREHDPWKDGSWKSKAREMWNRPVSDKVEVVSTPKQEAWWEDMAVRDEKANQATQSTQRCWKFEQGRCLYGEKCRFSHGEVPTAGSGQRGWRRQSWANGKVDTHNMKSFWGDG
ncbi:unnamed protein product [Durusdinium trenchii]|uniref:C3H1-type domain-containing protein n=1 Tax=Durusdinium trenchii TaxID=1381693 RepID=A0ABP0PIJ0_9DINO